MNALYPLKPVITSNPSLTYEYNTHLTSAFLISACLTARQVAELLDNGAKFDALVLVDGEGEELIARMGDPKSWDSETMPEIQKISLAQSESNPIAEIHKILQRNMLVAGMG